MIGPRGVMGKGEEQRVEDRVVIGLLDQQFAFFHRRNCSLISTASEDDIYREPRRSEGRRLSVVENVLRGAAAIEQTFGGLTANLWDDPFEWTLPENLSTAERIIEYLDEVEATRQRAFASFNRDRDLLKEIMVPAAETRALIDVLLEALVRTAEYFGRAAATLSTLSDSTTSESPG